MDDDQARAVAGPREEKRPEVSSSGGGAATSGVGGDAAALWQRQHDFAGEMLGPRPAVDSSARGGDGRSGGGRAGGGVVSFGGAEDFAGTFLNLDEIKGMSDDILIPTSASALRGLSMAMDTDPVPNPASGVGRQPSVGDFMMQSFPGHFDDQSGSVGVGAGMAPSGAAPLQTNFGHASTSGELLPWTRDPRASGSGSVDDHMRASTSTAMYRAGGVGPATSSKASTPGLIYQFPQNTLSPDGRSFDATGLHGHSVGPSGTNVAPQPVSSSVAAAAVVAVATAANAPAFQMRGMPPNEPVIDPMRSGTYTSILVPQEIECLKELLTVVGKLDGPTRTNIRDSLLRLARNAEMRKNLHRVNPKELNGADASQNNKPEMTHSMDKEVARLLFTNSFDLSRTPASDARRESPAFPDRGSGNGSFPS